MARNKSYLYAGAGVAGVAGVAGLVMLLSMKAQQQLVTYTVMVHVQYNGSPVPFATVQFGSYGIQTTDADGNCSFFGVVAGSYNLAVNAGANYQPYQSSATVGAGSVNFTANLSQAGSCVPQPCPCNQEWNNASCACETPSILRLTAASPAFTQFLSWQIVEQCISHNVCAGIMANSSGHPTQVCPSNALGCPSTNSCDPMKQTWSFNIYAQVTSGNGNPICGALITCSVGQALQTFLFTDLFCSVYQGSFSVQVEQNPGASDQNGVIAIRVLVTITGPPPSVIKWFGCGYPNCCGQTVNPNHVKFLDVITMTLVGNSAITATTDISFDNLICVNSVAA